MCYLQEGNSPSLIAGAPRDNNIIVSLIAGAPHEAVYDVRGAAHSGEPDPHQDLRAGQIQVMAGENRGEIIAFITAKPPIEGQPLNKGQLLNKGTPVNLSTTIDPLHCQWTATCASLS